MAILPSNAAFKHISLSTTLESGPSCVLGIAGLLWGPLPFPFCSSLREASAGVLTALFSNMLLGLSHPPPSSLFIPHLVALHSENIL